MKVAGRQFSDYRFKKFRRMRGFKQETVKRKLSLGSRVILSKWENGHTLPSLDTLKELARLYQCRPSDLLPELNEIPAPFPETDLV